MPFDFAIDGTLADTPVVTSFDTWAEKRVRARRAFAPVDQVLAGGDYFDRVPQKKCAPAPEAKAA